MSAEGVWHELSFLSVKQKPSSFAMSSSIVCDKPLARANSYEKPNILLDRSKEICEGVYKQGVIDEEACKG